MTAAECRPEYQIESFVHLLMWTNEKGSNAPLSREEKKKEGVHTTSPTQPALTCRSECAWVAADHGGLCSCVCTMYGSVAWATKLAWRCLDLFA